MVPPVSITNSSCPWTLARPNDRLHALTYGSAMEPGTKLGPYEITEQLGAGGIEVYLAQDTRLGRKVDSPQDDRLVR